MFVGHMNKGGKIDGYINNNLLEPLSLHSRHEALVQEMKYRGYNHNSPLPMLKQVRGYGEMWFKTIDRMSAEADLIDRCPLCAEFF
jgi:hypothetical protein